MRKLILISLMFCLTGCAHEAYAKSVTVQGGWQHTPNSNYGDGSEVVVRAEHEIVENQFGVLSGGAEYAYHGPTSRFPEDAPEYGDVSGHTAILEAIYYPPVKWKLEPYVLAGIGWGWWDFDRSEDTASRDIDVDLGNAKCVKYAIGANWRLNPTWSVNVEWAYFETDIPKNAHYSDGSFSNIMDTGPTVGHAETTLLVGVRVDF